jgi:hypothetical protein
LGTLEHKLRRSGRGIALAIVAGLLVGGCGVRGGLEKLPEERSSPTATAESGQGKPAGAAPKAHEGFILDGLIR